MNTSWKGQRRLKNFHIVRCLNFTASVGVQSAGLIHWVMSIQSAMLSLQWSELAPPTPSTASKCCKQVLPSHRFPPFRSGGDTLACGSGGGGSQFGHLKVRKAQEEMYFTRTLYNYCRLLKQYIIQVINYWWNLKMSDLERKISEYVVQFEPQSAVIKSYVIYFHNKTIFEYIYRSVATYDWHVQ